MGLRAHHDLTVLLTWDNQVVNRGLWATNQVEFQDSQDQWATLSVAHNPVECHPAA